MTLPVRGGTAARVGVFDVSWFAAFETYLYAAFVGGLALTPVWLGGNRLICWGFHAVLFGGLLIGWELGVLAAGRRHTVGLAYLLLPAALIGATVIWIVIQTAGFVPDSWKHPIWSMAAATLDRKLTGSISVNRELTMLALLRLLTAVAVFWMALQLCRDAKRANALLFSLAVTGFVYSAYGVLSLAIAPETNLWFKKEAYVGFVTATFVNRNSFASFAGVTLLAAIGVTLRLFRREIDRGVTGWRRILSKAIEATGKRGMFLLAMVFTIVVALLLSGSRAGITSTALGIFVLTTLVIARAERQRVGQIGTILTACAVILAAFLGYGDLFVGRLDTVNLDAAGRQAAYAIVVASIRDAPLLGFGYGTFQDVFPMYRDGSVGLAGVWDKAHNTYLELFQGLGVVFGTAFLTGIGLLIWRCVQASILRRQTSTVPIVAASASVLLGVHAFVDFSLQIQSITLIWSALLGAGVAQSWSSRKELDVV
jgi:O-antigen ligase